jgi:hypothetical protein
MSLGIVGQDWPDRYSELLSKRGIDLSGPIRHPTQQTCFGACGTISSSIQSRNEAILVLRQYGRLGLAIVAELARVRFFVEALKSGDSSYPKI